MDDRAASAPQHRPLAARPFGTTGSPARTVLAASHRRAVGLRHPPGRSRAVPHDDHVLARSEFLGQSLARAGRHDPRTDAVHRVLDVVAIDDR